ncbi:C6 finger domain [Mycena chlorophos]|uniref:C6 finger domain n=1 Tax=Mycena chlorophos TaxID=658473 RepID=A0A8H6TKD0_MYCCL|nr:C6 finger domain [Mycena chlorophos]
MTTPESASSSASSCASPADGGPKQRAPIACARCRQRKIKCMTTSTSVPCERCKKRGFQCDYIAVSDPRNLLVVPQYASSTSASSSPAASSSAAPSPSSLSSVPPLSDAGACRPILNGPGGIWSPGPGRPVTAPLPGFLGGGPARYPALGPSIPPSFPFQNPISTATGASLDGVSRKCDLPTSSIDPRWAPLPNTEWADRWKAPTATAVASQNAMALGNLEIQRFMQM